MTEINYISDVQFREVIKNIDQNATILFHQVLLLHCDNDMLLRKDLRDTSEVEDHFYGWICKSPNFGFIMMAAFIIGFLSACLFSACRLRGIGCLP
jgi:hypothetical protein